MTNNLKAQRDAESKDQRREVSDTPDVVEEAGVESFPTSDPPSWTLGVEQDEANGAAERDSDD